MKKEILKGFSMVLLVASFAFVAAVGSANGQSGTHVVANIPFDFVVGDKKMPAGDYTVQGITRGQRAVLISEREAKTSIIRLTNELRKTNDTRSRLVFHRYGQQYFLAEVWNGDETGRRLFRSQQERAIERELAALVTKTELARNTYETVEVLGMVR